MDKQIQGKICLLEGKKYFKISNYDCMDDFFMTITSSSDIWNFCWSKGGITAGRIDSNHAIFPYYTADKVSDSANFTGNYTSIAINKNGQIEFWEPFTAMHAVPSIQKQAEKFLIRNLYKNENGTEILFEEINTKLNLSFITGWTSSEKFGIVRSSKIMNLSDEAVEISILDGCQNILPACCTSDFQNSNSILLDAYKKTDLEEKSNLALFTVSSVVSDKAEPNEGLFANTCWFSTQDKIILNTDAPSLFASMETLPDYKAFNPEKCIKGQRPSCFICKKITLQKQNEKESSEKWYQVFDTSLTLGKITELKILLENRKALVTELEADIQRCDKVMTDFIQAADGIQNTGEEITCLHHRQNVMFNIMRGGIILDEGKIQLEDFISFANQRNKQLAIELSEVFKETENKKLSCGELKLLIEKQKNPQYLRIFYEYLPLTFSRRHGDPSRPWNAFSIKIKTPEGKPVLNYEGNWRDIFQNWEALAYSYPEYIKTMCTKFLNAMTIDGFNPYKINREGIDWELPDSNNPWAQIGYWGDHQIIYFEKLLEFYSNTNRKELLNSVNEKLYTSSNVPYRIDSYKNILANPRNTILFNKELSQELLKAAKEKGSDQKLIQNSQGLPYLVTFSAKVLQIVLTKLSNFIPGGGIWLNTQRPEWNDANNALAGYGLSVVTLCYLCRFLNTLIDIYSNTQEKQILLPKPQIQLLRELNQLFSSKKPEEICGSNKLRKEFIDKVGVSFEKERFIFYENGYNNGEETIPTEEILQALKEFQKHVEYSILANKREDGLYHSYNTLKISNDEMSIVYLQEMLEGQVAVLSSGLLSVDEAEHLVMALQNSKMYEPKQNSFMLYPNKTLPDFVDKNCVSEITGLENLIARTGSLYLEKDKIGIYHFNANFRNAMVIEDFINQQPENSKPSEEEKSILLKLYEKTFNHQAFTGRSGTFYAYEGLGSIYWHMVSKLLLAVQENVFKAYKENNNTSFNSLKKLYYEVRSGLSYNKTPELYGAFPADPYSHTPYLKGAKQPGMTGQVKEEILTRWGELGIFVENGSVKFNPIMLRKTELKADNSVDFTWCGTPIKYIFNGNIFEIGDFSKCTITVNEIKRNGCELTQEETVALFSRSGKISKIQLEF